MEGLIALDILLNMVRMGIIDVDTDKTMHIEFDIIILL